MKLQEAHANCDHATMRLNQTPLHIAAFAGHGHCLKWLLHCGAAVDRQVIRQTSLKHLTCAFAVAVGLLEEADAMDSSWGRLWHKKFEVSANPPSFGRLWWAPPVRSVAAPIRRSCWCTGKRYFFAQIQNWFFPVLYMLRSMPKFILLFRETLLETDM